MRGFITQSGTVYYVDDINKLIVGGKITNPTPYTHLSAILGTRAQIVLINGCKISTNVVVNYI